LMHGKRAGVSMSTTIDICRLATFMQSYHLHRTIYTVFFGAAQR
jgi:hypothetical protein